ncbi:hypothetical protein IQ06DRAFT_343216 [Phaeosphaeriaceae sp. SRC1lsM3a]|nr:hypothetical protein IQ06DRAFT_343216 [Stagonospora sp. SRC1lsM3a]
MPSSREASEEPELLSSTPHNAGSSTTTPDKVPTRGPADTDSLGDGRKKRRFSLTSFHRSSRSRSRPNSIAMPSNVSFFSSTPKGTPPRELSRILGEERGRPHSYHAPDSWNLTPAPRSVSDNYLQSTPPREQSRLGVLPSPAKSAFSAQEREDEQDIPPVPQIPEIMRLSNDLSHEVLQSVIRYSTPPLPTANNDRKLATSPVFLEDSIDEASGKPEQKAAHMQHPPEHAHQFKSSSPNLGELESNTNMDGDAAPQTSTQWPLVDFQPGASVSKNGNENQLAQQMHSLPPQSQMSTNINHPAFDDDDQPPRLSYEPIPSSSRSDEAEPLPSYLIPMHLDVSDDEEMDKDLGLDKDGTNSLLQKPHVQGQSVSPLLPPAKSLVDEVPVHGQILAPQGDEMSSAPAAPEPGATLPPDSAGPRLVHNEALQSNIPTKSAEPRPISSIPSVALDNSMAPSEGSNVLLDPSRRDTDDPGSDAEGRLQAISPGPVWFTGSKLHVAKARSRDAGDDEDDVHVSDHEKGEGGWDAANTGLAQAQTGVALDASSHGPRPMRNLEVVHAVEEYAASDSSFASWDDSAVANSVSGSSQPGDMRDESDLATPVAQVPKIVHHAQADDQAEAHSSRSLAAPNGYFTGHEPRTMHLPQQQSTDLTVPERSKSMLSMISSMVSEGGTPISPSTSNAGRSTPSTIRRMQRESPGKGPATSDRIPEEPIVNYDDHTPPAKDDDFDLYADHNGIVKDVRDESGQPLRVAQSRDSDVREQMQATKAGLPGSAAVAPESRQEDRPRYSTERPMSFVSGPTDQDGRPQDQLNQSMQHNNGASHPSIEHLPSQDGRSNYPAAPHDNAAQRSESGPEIRDMGQNHPAVQNHMVAAGHISQNIAPTPRRAQLQQLIDPAGPDLPSKTPASSSHPPLVNGHQPLHSPDANQHGQDPRIYGTNPPQTVPQRTAAGIQDVMPDQDPRHSGQPNILNAGPRNQYGFQQHVLQPPTQYSRAQAAAGHDPFEPAQAPKEHTFKQQEKPSSLPKFSSVFKGLGGKLQGNNHNQQTAHPPNATLWPDERLHPVEHTRMPSSHSAVSSLNREQLSVRGGEQAGPPISPNRTPSNGAESHFSHISQGSTNVQPAGSRVDLRKPASPMPFQGIPPKLMPASIGASHNKLPEKKKRFSALGNIFARSSDANQAKTKLSKEEKKAQKTQRNSTAPPMQTPAPQWPPHQQQQFRPPQQSMPVGPSQYPPREFIPQQKRPTGPQYASQQTMPPPSMQSAQSVDPYGVPQRYQQAQPGIPPQQHVQGLPQGQASAYQSTRQLAEQHQAQKALGGVGPVIPPNMDLPRQPHAQHALLPHQQNSYGPPPGGYYNPNPTPSMPEKGAYSATQAARTLAEQQRRQMTHGQDIYSTPHEPLQPQHQQHPQPLAHEQEAYRLLQLERLRLEQQRLQLEAERRSFTVGGAEHPQHRQPEPPNTAYNARMEGRQHPQQQPLSTSRVEHQQPVQHHHQHDVARDTSHDDLLRAHQERQQLEQQLRAQQYADRVQSNHRSVSGPLPGQNLHAQAPPAQRHVSSPIAPSIEPQYDTPQIPAAYNHVSGAFVSPPDLEPHSQPPAPYEPNMRPQQYERQPSDSRMPPLSPQVSAQSQMHTGNRTHSDASIASVVSPLSAQAQDLPIEPAPPTQRSQKPRMSSISEVHPGTAERPWHLNFPEGATEQEIVRARQRQFMQQQFSAQQQQHAERAAQSPSPRVSSHSQSPIPPQPSSTSTPSQQGGGFKELLPRSSPQPYTQTDLARTSGSSDQPGLVESTQPAQLPSHQPERGPSPATYPLPMSPEPRGATSPVNPLADALSAPPPPPKSPHGQIHPMGPTQQAAGSPAQQHAANAREQSEPSPPQSEQYVAPPPVQASQLDQTLPDDPPPSYDGPGVPNDGMDKTRPDRVRPPNIATDLDSVSRGRQGEPRARQPSIGILQHPQPASMAASPQRSSADMGAESLRRQLLQQEEYARMERIQRAQIQRAESERERQEREAARARARELERSVSGGTRVGSIRSVAGSRNGGQPGWERRGSTSRPVFELPAVEDDEPSMRATSYPGQEWVPHVWTDD